MLRARLLVAVLLSAGLLAASTVAAQEPTAPIFRVFLTDGTALASYGEWARVDSYLVFSIPIGAKLGGGLQLVTLPVASIDWPRTEAYRDTLRGTHYASTRGEADFAALTNDVARILNEIALLKEPKARLQRAETARAALAGWPKAHYGFKSTEVREMVGMLDEIVGELRASAGLSQFELALTTDAASPPAERELPPPSDQDVLNQLMVAASLSTTSTERTSLLRTVLGLLDRAVDALPQTWSAELRQTALGKLAAEERIDRAYAALRTSTLEAASRYATSADVRGLERVRGKLITGDQSLGRQRPEDVVAVLTTVDMQLDSARRLRLVRDQWQVRWPAYQAYQKSMQRPLDFLSSASPSLEEIRAMAGPSPALLRDLIGRLRAESTRLPRLNPPPGLAPVHAIISSAWELAQSAMQLRLDAVTQNSLDGASRASAAASGALMLLGRARTDLLAALQPPR